MLSLFKKKNPDIAIPDKIYGTVVARSRQPLFFTDFGVQDSVMGRFDILSLHVYLFARRMKQEQGDVAVSLSQEVFDCFVADVDRALRELGIGDTSVPKKKKKMIRSFYGQIDDFDGPLLQGDMKALDEKVLKRFYEGSDGEAFSGKLSAYIAEMAANVSSSDFKDILQGNFDWPQYQGLDAK